MDALNPDLVAALVTLAGVGGTASLAFYAVRRARAARRRDIEGSEPRRAVEKPKRRSLRAEDIDADLAVGAPEGEPEAEPEPAAPETPARAPAQVLPFPAPSAPVEKPRRPDAAALAPGLARTRAGWVSRLGQLFAGRKELDQALVDDIEKVLLTADIGVRTSGKLLEELRGSLGKRDLQEPSAIWGFLRRRTTEILSVGAAPVDLKAARPFVVLVIGVNGSGKTTTIGKLAAKLKTQGHSVMLSAGDTFRAGAAEQLEVWGKRVGAPVVRGKE